MISRRQLRVKTLHTLYAFFKTGDKSIQIAEKELFHSIEKMHELYFSLFILPGEVQRYAQKRSEIRRQKQTASADELNPNTKFLENSVIHMIQESEGLEKYMTEKKIGWGNYPELIKKLYEILTESEYFAEYLNSPDDSFKRDKDLVKFFFSDLLYNSSDLYQTLEEKSIYWLDDVDFVLSMIVKTIKDMKKNRPETLSFMPLFQNDDDKDFVKTLFRKTLLNHAEYQNLIENQVVNWDVDRIAFTDKLILLMAIAEIIEFNSIPVKVSFNEYIELAKKYGSEKSGSFINGVLDKLIEKLTQENKIHKTGRGLIDS
jgi:N utilization substance protein B